MLLVKDGRLTDLQVCITLTGEPTDQFFILHFDFMKVNTQQMGWHFHTAVSFHLSKIVAHKIYPDKAGQIQTTFFNPFN
jgi:hypothetical protein